MYGTDRVTDTAPYCFGKLACGYCRDLSFLVIEVVSSEGLMYGSLQFAYDMVMYQDLLHEARAFIHFDFLVRPLYDSLCSLYSWWHYFRWSSVKSRILVASAIVVRRKLNLPNSRFLLFPLLPMQLQPVSVPYCSCCTIECRHPSQAYLLHPRTQLR